MVLKLKASYSVSKPPNTPRDYFVVIIEIKGLCIQCSEITSWNSSGLIQVLEVTGIVSRLHTKVTRVKSITQLGEPGLAGCGLINHRYTKWWGLVLILSLEQQAQLLSFMPLTKPSVPEPCSFCWCLCHTKEIPGSSHSKLCVLEHSVPHRAGTSQLCSWGLWSRSL